MSLFARERFEGINQWLAANPVVLGLGAAALGLVLAGTGVLSLLSGRASSKWGAEVEGGQARALAVVRLVGGLACLGFGVYKIVTGRP